MHAGSEVLLGWSGALCWGRCGNAGIQALSGNGCLTASEWGVDDGKLEVADAYSTGHCMREVFSGEWPDCWTADCALWILMPSPARISPDYSYGLQQQ